MKTPLVGQKKFHPVKAVIVQIGRAAEGYKASGIPVQDSASNELYY